jgi:hypothetical protein
MKKYVIKINRNETSATHVVCRQVFLYLHGISDHLWKTCSDFYKKNPDYRGEGLDKVTSLKDESIPALTYMEVEEIFKNHLPGETIGNFYIILHHIIFD